MQSTFFGPIKYALLPQLLKKDELLAGNGYIEGSTYTMPHDELTSIANKLINKYKTEAEKAKHELNNVQEKANLVYPNYKDSFTSYKVGFFEPDTS